MQTQAQFINLLKSLLNVFSDEIISDTSFTIYLDEPISFEKMEALYLTCKKYKYRFLTCNEGEGIELLITKTMAASAAA